MIAIIKLYTDIHFPPNRGVKMNKSNRKSRMNRLVIINMNEGKINQFPPKI